MTGWDLPTTVSVKETSYRIHADYRDILGVLEQLNDPENAGAIGIYVALNLFYEDFQKLSPADYREAWEKLCWFINGGEKESRGPAIKRIDWEQDRNLIVADVNRVAGVEVRGLRFCHWWTFLAWFRAVGEGQLSTVVGIREKHRKGKALDQWERDFYRENREKVDFKIRMTSEEEETLDLWLGKEG